MKLNGLRIFRPGVEKYFDSSFYVNQLHELDIDIDEPWEHYVNIGWKCGFSPSADFSVDQYWNANIDVFNAGVEPLEHWVKYGKSENRKFKVSPWEDKQAQELLRGSFNPVFYLNYNKLYNIPLEDAIGHFCRVGWRLLYDPNPEFDTFFYKTFENLEFEQAYPYFLHYLLNRHNIPRPVTYPSFRTAWDLSNIGMLTPRSATKRKQPEPQTAPSIQFDLQNIIGLLKERGFNFSGKLLVSWGNNDYSKVSGGIEVIVMRELNDCLSASMNHLYIYRNVSNSESNESVYNFYNLIINGSIHLKTTTPVLETLVKYLNERGSRSSFHLHGKNHSELLDVARIASYSSEKKFLIHDYSFICSSYTLMRNDIEYCSAPESSSTSCHTCIAGDGRKQYLDDHGKFLGENDFSVISPSETATRLFNETFPSVEIKTRPHLNFIESSKSIGKSRVNNEKYRIAFTGHSAHHKGWDLFELLSRHVASRNDFECFHLGNGPKSTYIDFIRVDSVNGKSNMQSALLSNEIDIVFQWSLWPETFGLVTAEALAAGCLVITNPGSGNLEHMATQYSRGLVFESFEQLIIDHDSGELKAEVSRRKKAIESTSLDLNWNSFVDLTGKK